MVASAVERALGYPYPRPASSFLFRPGRGARPFPCKEWPGLGGLPDFLQHLGEEGSPSGCAAWTPVLAIGSNASPQQLERKFPVELFPDAIIPAIKGQLRDFDVAYAPLLSSYGSVTATLEHSPACTVEVFVTYLEASLLERMHATEGGYDLVTLDDVRLELGNGEVLTQVAQYNHQRGTLHVPVGDEPGPVALAEIPAVGREFPARTQREMQEFVHGFLGAEGEFGDKYVLENLEDDDTRKARVETLLQAAKPFRYEKAVVQKTLGSMFDKQVK